MLLLAKVKYLGDKFLQCVYLSTLISHNRFFVGVFSNRYFYVTTILLIDFVWITIMRTKFYEFEKEQGE